MFSQMNEKINALLLDMSLNFTGLNLIKITSIFDLCIH